MIRKCSLFLILGILISVSNVNAGINHLNTYTSINNVNTLNDNNIKLLGSGNTVATINNNSYTSLEDAINNAAHGDTIYLTSNVSTGEQLNQALIIDKNITIDGNGYSIMRTSSYTGALFNISSNGVLTLKNIIIDGGASSWSMSYSIKTADGTATDHIIITTSNEDEAVKSKSNSIRNEGKFILDNAIVKNFYGEVDSQYGTSSAIIYSTGDMTIKNKSEIIHNLNRRGTGNVIYTNGGNLTINDSKISNNGNAGKFNGESSISPGFGGFASVNNTVLNINNTLFDSNFAELGSVFQGNFIETNITNAKFNKNIASNDGTFYIWGNTSTAKIKIDSSTFDANLGIAQGNQSIGGIFFMRLGGGIKDDVINLDINNSIFKNNEACAGSVYADYAPANVKIRKSDFLENTASSGGVFYIQTNSNIQIEDCNFKKNKAYMGGVLYTYNTNESTISFTNTNILDNRAEVNGGAIYTVSRSAGSKVIIDKGTIITNNKAGRYGGGVYLTHTSDLPTETYGSTFEMKEASKLFNNSASSGGDDLAAVGREMNPKSIKLLDAKAMNEKTKDGYTITGWYYDTPDDYKNLLYKDEQPYLHRFKRNVSGKLPTLDLTLGENVSESEFLFIKAESDGIVTSSETKKVSRIISYVYQNGKKASEDVVQEAIFTREVKTNSVTGEVTYGKWNKNKISLSVVKSPIIKGYSADKKIINSIDVNYDSKNINEVVTYRKTKKKVVKTSDNTHILLGLFMLTSSLLVIIYLRKHINS